MELTKGVIKLKWIESTGQFTLSLRSGETVYVSAWEGSNQQAAQDIIDLMKAYLLTRRKVTPLDRDEGV